ncbi:MAG: alpha/beta hydrolase [Bacteroidetes bacterium]|jgi:3-oxoadipate enol-lactonase|nr:alpha/beta hydrolase [Bacteroidota bacterium]
MNFTNSQNQIIFYELKGNLNSTQTIVFLNGLTQSTLSWFFVLPYFEKEYKIVLLDFVFQGQSTKDADWKNFNEHAKDVFELLNFLKINQPIICGISYGSLVAQHFAVNYPNNLNKLILLATFAHKTPYYNAIELSWWNALKIGGYNLLLDIMLPSVLSENYFTNPVIPIELMKESRKELNQNATAIFNLMQATKAREDYRPELKKIIVKTLVLQGEKDLLLPVHLAQEVHKNINNSKFDVIKNAGHTLNLEFVPQVCEKIIYFLNEK